MLLNLTPAEFNSGELNKTNKMNKTIKNKKNVSFDDDLDSKEKTKTKITNLNLLLSNDNLDNETEDTTTNYKDLHGSSIKASQNNDITDEINNQILKLQESRNQYQSKMNTTNQELENPSDSYDSNENISSNNFNNKVYSNLEDSYKSNLDFLPKNLSQNTLDDNYKLLSKLDYIIHLLEEQHNEKTNHINEELILYLFLGIFMIFVLDSFARASKYIR
tara:strand:- start:523 stop:1179 length:657 start_codon:yes stop_codon:yes gene_type:complete